MFAGYCFENFNKALDKFYEVYNKLCIIQNEFRRVSDDAARHKRPNDLKSAELQNHADYITAEIEEMKQRINNLQNEYKRRFKK